MPSTQDPDTSPETQIEESSTSTPQDQKSVEGGTTAPPAERDKSTGEEEESSIPLLGEGDVLDRLTNRTRKKRGRKLPLRRKKKPRQREKRKPTTKQSSNRRMKKNSRDTTAKPATASSNTSVN